MDELSGSEILEEVLIEYLNSQPMKSTSEMSEEEGESHQAFFISLNSEVLAVLRMREQSSYCNTINIRTPNMY